MASKGPQKESWPLRRMTKVMPKALERNTRSWIVAQQSNLRDQFQEYEATLDKKKVTSGGRGARRSTESNSVGSDLAWVNMKLTESLARISLPKSHPDVYNGDVTMFRPWKSSFKGMIRDCHLSPEQEMNYLSTVHTPLGNL